MHFYFLFFFLIPFFFQMITFRCCFSAHLIFLFFSVSFMFVYPLIRIQWQIFRFVHSFCCFLSNLHFSIFFLPSNLVLGFYQIYFKWWPKFLFYYDSFILFLYNLIYWHRQNNFLAATKYLTYVIFSKF